MLGDTCNCIDRVQIAHAAGWYGTDQIMFDDLAGPPPGWPLERWRLQEEAPRNACGSDESPSAVTAGARRGTVSGPRGRTRSVATSVYWPKYPQSFEHARSR